MGESNHGAYSRGLKQLQWQFATLSASPIEDTASLPESKHWSKGKKASVSDLGGIFSGILTFHLLGESLGGKERNGEVRDVGEGC